MIGLKAKLKRNGKTVKIFATDNSNVLYQTDGDIKKVAINELRFFCPNCNQDELFWFDNPEDAFCLNCLHEVKK